MTYPTHPQISRHIQPYLLEMKLSSLAKFEGWQKTHVLDYTFLRAIFIFIQSLLAKLLHQQEPKRATWETFLFTELGVINYNERDKW